MLEGVGRTNGRVGVAVLDELAGAREHHVAGADQLGFQDVVQIDRGGAMFLAQTLIAVALGKTEQAGFRMKSSSPHQAKKRVS